MIQEVCHSLHHKFNHYFQTSKPTEKKESQSNRATPKSILPDLHFPTKICFFAQATSINNAL